MPIEPTVFDCFPTEDYKLKVLAQKFKSFHGSLSKVKLLFFRLCLSFLFLCCCGLSCCAGPKMKLLKAKLGFLDEISEDALESDH